MNSPKELSSPSVDKAEPSPIFQEFYEKLAAFATPEEKIAHGLAFMRTSISQEGTPRFREFWEARRAVLPFFKENLNSVARSKLWDEYVELTVEARRLKEILEEQSTFAMEQIDLAIRALEGDISNFEALLGQVGEISFPQESPTIQQKASLYNQVQRELHLLNTLANRLTGLRKEIVKTDMRIRFKTRFLKCLSELGDHIFPKRRELIEQISSEFEKDVEQFIANYFREGQAAGVPYYALKEEIKALQSVAKILTLSSPAFSRTRLKLSACWDQIKTFEKEHRKFVSEKRQASSEQTQSLQAKIEELKGRSEEMALRDLDKELANLSREMRALPLQREDVRFLRDEMEKLRAPHVAEQEKKAREFEETEREKLRLKREKILAAKEQIANLLKEGPKMDLEILVAGVDEMKKELEGAELSKVERQQLERQLRPLQDLIADKKEQSLLNLSDDEKKTLENLHLVLEQKKQRRKEIKEQLESHRKHLSTSGLDFEKAMLYRELIDQEKERFDTANRGIEEIEQKIAQLEG